MNKRAAAVACGFAVLAGITIAVMLDRNRPNISAPAVQVCIDYTNLIRLPDEDCEQGEQGAKWVYLLNYHQEIPGVDGRIWNGHYTFNRPAGEIPRAPEGGAKFVAP